MKLHGRRILITGGGSGIGLELARRLAQANTAETRIGRVKLLAIAVRIAPGIADRLAARSLTPR
jgi:NAD(P)-dependent dehydrogenase (short-subunit alcohol dehydrogenase family)